MTDSKTFNTVQDIAEYVSENHYRAKTRWVLREYETWAWVNEEAGRDWNAERAALSYVWDSDLKRAAYDIKAAELQARLPEKKRIMQYNLMEIGDRYRPKYINLSEELGLQLKAIWTVRKTRWSESFVSLTILGILKRLGNTEIDAQIKAAEKKAKEAYERNSRNRIRERARRLAQELLDLYQNNPEMIFPAQLTEIVTMEDEVVND